MAETASRLVDDRAAPIIGRGDLKVENVTEARAEKPGRSFWGARKDAYIESAKINFDKKIGGMLGKAESVPIEVTHEAFEDLRRADTQNSLKLTSAPDSVNPSQMHYFVQGRVSAVLMLFKDRGKAVADWDSKELIKVIGVDRVATLSAERLQLIARLAPKQSKKRDTSFIKAFGVKNLARLPINVLGAIVKKVESASTMKEITIKAAATREALGQKVFSRLCTLHDTQLLPEILIATPKDSWKENRALLGDDNLIAQFYSGEHVAKFDAGAADLERVKALLNMDPKKLKILINIRFGKGKLEKRGNLIRDYDTETLKIMNIGSDYEIDMDSLQCFSSILGKKTLAKLGSYPEVFRELPFIAPAVLKKLSTPLKSLVKSGKIKEATEVVTGLSRSNEISTNHICKVIRVLGAEEFCNITDPIVRIPRILGFKSIGFLRKIRRNISDFATRDEVLPYYDRIISAKPADHRASAFDMLGYMRPHLLGQIDSAQHLDILFRAPFRNIQEFEPHDIISRIKAGGLQDIEPIIMADKKNCVRVAKRLRREGAIAREMTDGKQSRGRVEAGWRRRKVLSQVGFAMSAVAASSPITSSIYLRLFHGERALVATPQDEFVPNVSAALLESPETVPQMAQELANIKALETLELMIAQHPETVQHWIGYVSSPESRSPLSHFFNSQPEPLSAISQALNSDCLSVQAKCDIFQTPNLAGKILESLEHVQYVDAVAAGVSKDPELASALDQTIKNIEVSNPIMKKFELGDHVSRSDRIKLDNIQIDGDLAMLTSYNFDASGEIVTAFKTGVVPENLFNQLYDSPGLTQELAKFVGEISVSPPISAAAENFMARADSITGNQTLEAELNSVINQPEEIMAILAERSPLFESFVGVPKTEAEAIATSLAERLQAADIRIAENPEAYLSQKNGIEEILASRSEQIEQMHASLERLSQGLPAEAPATRMASFTDDEAVATKLAEIIAKRTPEMQPEMVADTQSLIGHIHALRSSEEVPYPGLDVTPREIAEAIFEVELAPVGADFERITMLKETYPELVVPSKESLAEWSPELKEWAIQGIMENYSHPATANHTSMPVESGFTDVNQVPEMERFLDALSMAVNNNNQIPIDSYAGVDPEKAEALFAAVKDVRVNVSHNLVAPIDWSNAASATIGLAVLGIVGYGLAFKKFGFSTSEPQTAQDRTSFRSTRADNERLVATPDFIWDYFENSQQVLEIPEPYSALLVKMGEAKFKALFTKSQLRETIAHIKDDSRAIAEACEELAVFASDEFSLEQIRAMGGQEVVKVFRRAYKLNEEGAIDDWLSTTYRRNALADSEAELEPDSTADKLAVYREFSPEVIEQAIKSLSGEVQRSKPYRKRLGISGRFKKFTASATEEQLLAGGAELFRLQSAQDMREVLLMAQNGVLENFLGMLNNKKSFADEITTGWHHSQLAALRTKIFPKYACKERDYNFWKSFDAAQIAALGKSGETTIDYFLKLRRDNKGIKESTFTPAVKRLANEAHIDLNTIKAFGEVSNDKAFAGAESMISLIGAERFIALQSKSSSVAEFLAFGKSSTGLDKADIIFGEKVAQLAPELPSPESLSLLNSNRFSVKRLEAVKSLSESRNIKTPSAIFWAGSCTFLEFLADMKIADIPNVQNIQGWSEVAPRLKEAGMNTNMVGKLMQAEDGLVRADLLIELTEKRYSANSQELLNMPLKTIEALLTAYGEAETPAEIFRLAPVNLLKAIATFSPTRIIEVGSDLSVWVNDETDQFNRNSSQRDWTKRINNALRLETKKGIRSMIGGLFTSGKKGAVAGNEPQSRYQEQ